MNVPAPAKPAEPIHVLHRDLSTQNQTNVLLSVCETMMGYLQTNSRETENIPGMRPLPGESRLAVEATLIKACERLDLILDDSSRWGTDFQIALEATFVENARFARDVAAAQTKAFQSEAEKAEAQKRAALEVQSPHFLYRPALVKLDDGQWAAYLGELGSLEPGVVGVGADPAAASRAFDLAFLGALTAEQQKVIEQRIKELNEIDTLDTGGNQATQEIAGGGQEHSGDRPAS
jgi:hypothetical protein